MASTLRKKTLDEFKRMLQEKLICTLPRPEGVGAWHVFKEHPRKKPPWDASCSEPLFSRELYNICAGLNTAALKCDGLSGNLQNIQLILCLQFPLARSLVKNIKDTFSLRCNKVSISRSLFTFYVFGAWRKPTTIMLLKCC